MKIKNPNQKIEIEFPNQKIKSENENQICKTLFTHTHTYTLNCPSSWQEICCHQWINCIICYINNKAKYIYINIYTYNIIYIFSNICINIYNIMHINSIISCANIMQLQISKHEQAYIAHNKQQAAIQQTQPHHQQAKQADRPSPGKLYRRQSTTGPQCAMSHIGQNFNLYIIHKQR